MQSGAMRHQVTLQEKSVTRDEFGGEVVTWVEVTTVWAELDPWQMRERLSTRRMQGEAVIGLRVRAPLEVSMAKRFLFEGTGYGVIDIDATRKHKGELLVTCRAEDSAP